MKNEMKWNLIISIVGVLIVCSAVGILLVGSSWNNTVFSFKSFFILHYVDIALQLIFTSFTILFIDRLYVYREKGHYQTQLIMQMRSGDNSASRLAILEFIDNSWLQGGELKGKMLNGAIFEEITFPQRANFSGAKLRKSRFLHSILHNANFHKSDLRDANFSFSKVLLTNFKEAILIKADLSNADFAGSNFSGASLQGADLRGTSFINCNIDNWDITDAQVDGNTILPKKLGLIQ